jgi:hypothetical protein
MSVSPRWPRIALQRSAQQVITYLATPLSVTLLTLALLTAMFNLLFVYLWFGMNAAWDTLRNTFLLLAASAAAALVILVVEYLKTKRFCRRLTEALRTVPQGDGTVLLYCNREKEVLQDGELIRDCFVRAGWSVAGVNASSEYFVVKQDQGFPLRGVTICSPSYTLASNIRNGFARSGIRIAILEAKTKGEWMSLSVHSRLELPWRGR